MRKICFEITWDVCFRLCWPFSQKGACLFSIVVCSFVLIQKNQKIKAATASLFASQTRASRSNSDALGRSVPVVRFTLTSRGRSCFSLPSASGSFSSLVVMLTLPLSLGWILYRFFSCLFPYLSLLKIHWAYIPEYLNFDNLFYCGLRYNLHL